jgi:DNA-binding Xre family transcriptional regulator
MARPRTVQLQTLFDNLPAGGVVSAADLVDRLGVTRTTLSRLVAEAGDRVVRLGRTRATAYAVR